MGRRRKDGEGRESDQEVGMETQRNRKGEEGENNQRERERNMGVIIEIMSSITLVSESAQLELRTFKELSLTVEGKR